MAAAERDSASNLVLTFSMRTKIRSSLRPSAPESMVRGTGSASVLVAEPLSEIRQAWRELLLQTGARVYEVSSGQGLLSALGEHSFDLVVGTTELPGTSGLQVLAEARARGISTPFILSQSGHGELIRVVISEGCTGTVLGTRVLDLDGLLETAKRLLAQNKPRFNEL
jgi:CheY-like chemotaxis protein